MSNNISRAWLYVRGLDSVRIVIDGAQVAVYGPGAQFNHSAFREVMDATLHHAALELVLVRDGWTLEGLTTERRSRSPARSSVFPERRSPLRLVRNDGQAIRR